MNSYTPKLHQKGWWTSKMSLIILLLSEIIGDFYLQSKTLATSKKKSLWCLFVHALIVGATVFIFSLIFFQDIVWIPAVVIFITHFIIDLPTSGLLKSKITNKKYLKFVDSPLSFFVDQTLHMTIIVVVYFILKDEIVLSSQWYYIVGLGKYMTNLAIYMWALLVIFVLLLPSKFIVEKALIFSGVDEKKASDKKSSMIGYIERIIYFVSIISGYPVIISFVLGVKTWSQSEKLKDDDSFVSTYLIGSLLSLAIALALSYLFVFMVKLDGSIINFG